MSASIPVPQFLPSLWRASRLRRLTSAVLGPPIYLQRRPDCVLLGSATLLALLGLLFIASTEHVPGMAQSTTYWQRHLRFLLGGGVISVAIWSQNPRVLRVLGWLLYGASIVLLIAVLAAGESSGGARRRLWLFVMFQPAEIARLATLLVFCDWLTMPRRPDRWRHVLIAVAIVGIPFALILVEPSFGNAATLVPAAGAVLAVHLARGRLLKAALVGAFTCGCLFLIGLVSIRALNLDAMSLYESIRRYTPFDYHAYRLAFFIHPLGCFSTLQSQMAIVGGGDVGMGLFSGVLKETGFIPRTVAHSDYILSVVAEETGRRGVALLVILFALISLSGLEIAAQARSHRERLTAVALTTLITVNACLNMGMAAHALPVMGLPLPLVSYGGTFSIMILASLGIVLNIHRNSRRVAAAGDLPEETFSWTLDLAFAVCRVSRRREALNHANGAD